jgi:hypothetical protein
MKHVSAASVLLLIGGVLVIAGLPLQWSAIGASSRTGLDYAGYDIGTTVVLGLLLIASAFTVVAAWRWARILGFVAALLSGFWALLVVLAAANPSENGSAVNASVGAGAWVVSAGAGLALVGAVLSFRGRNAAPIVAGAALGV